SALGGRLRPGRSATSSRATAECEDGWAGLRRRALPDLPPGARAGVHRGRGLWNCPPRSASRGPPGDRLAPRRSPRDAHPRDRAVLRRADARSTGRGGDRIRELGIRFSAGGGPSAGIALYQGSVPEPFLGTGAAIDVAAGFPSATGSQGHRLTGGGAVPVRGRRFQSAGSDVDDVPGAVLAAVHRPIREVQEGPFVLRVLP